MKKLLNIRKILKLSARSERGKLKINVEKQAKFI